MRRFMVILLALLAPLTGCETNKATGRSQFVLLSWAQETELGAQSMAELSGEYGGAVRDAALNNYVTDIGRRLAQHTAGEVPGGLPWEFTLLDSGVINAFALPGGKVFFSRGLAEKLTDEAQMAMIMGHEIGHVTARHTNERVSHSMAVAGIAELVNVGASGQEGWIAQTIPLIVGVGGQGYLLKFNRDQESEADKLGMEYMVREGYDPAAVLDVMRVLAEASAGGQQPEILSTHPLPATRIRKGQDLIENKYAFTQNNPQYQRFAQRYQRQFLDRAALLPPPADAQSRLDLSDPTTWCWHCAHRIEP